MTVKSNLEVAIAAEPTFGLVNLDRNARKPVFGVSDKVVIKSVCSATETS